MKILPYLFLLLMVLASCEPEELEPVLTSPETKVLIQPIEELKDGERSLVLRNKTEKIYPCINFDLGADKVLTPESFKITFTGVNEKDICATAIGPATNEIDLGNVPEGDYYVELNNGTIKNKGVLSITSKEIELYFAQQNGIEILIPRLQRVPSNTYWGIIGYHNPNAAPLVNEIMEELKALGAEFSPQRPGNYGHYQVDAQGEIEAPQNHGYYYVKPLIFQYSQDSAGLTALIKALGEEYKGKVYLYLNSSTGVQMSGR